MQRRDDDGVEAAAIAALVPLEGTRVLEVGCGKGRLTALAAARASSVYAFDPSAENVAAARAALTSEQRRRVLPLVAADHNPVAALEETARSPTPDPGTATHSH